MMTKYMNLVITSPDRIIYEDKVKKILTENEIGKIEILPQHISFITSLVQTTTVIVDKDDKKHSLNTSQGYMHVTNNKVNIICDYPL